MLTRLHAEGWCLVDFFKPADWIYRVHEKGGARLLGVVRLLGIIRYVVYLLLLLYCGHSFGALMYLKTKTLSNVLPSSFLPLLQKVQLSGWYFESCRPIPSAIRNMEVTTFACFYNFDLAQDFSCSVKRVECGQIFLFACQQLRKKGQHNCIGKL